MKFFFYSKFGICKVVWVEVEFWRLLWTKPKQENNTRFLLLFFSSPIFLFSYPSYSLPFPCFSCFILSSCSPLPMPVCAPNCRSRQRWTLPTSWKRWQATSWMWSSIMKTTESLRWGKELNAVKMQICVGDGYINFRQQTEIRRTIILFFLFPFIMVFLFTRDATNAIYQQQTSSGGQHVHRCTMLCICTEIICKRLSSWVKNVRFSP